MDLEPVAVSVPFSVIDTRAMMSLELVFRKGTFFHAGLEWTVLSIKTSFPLVWKIYLKLHSTA